MCILLVFMTDAHKDLPSFRVPKGDRDVCFFKKEKLMYFKNNSFNFPFQLGFQTLWPLLIHL